MLPMQCAKGTLTLSETWLRLRGARPGYRLVAAEAGSAAQVLELALAKSLPASHRIVHYASGAAGAGAGAA